MREPLGERGPKLRAGQRPPAERDSPVREDRLEIQAFEDRREVAVARQLDIEHRLDERTEGERVLARDEVDRPAHHDDPDEPSRGQGVGERGRLEALETRPQGRVRVVRDLRLEPDETADCVLHTERGALEQKLARERRAVQGA